MSSSAIEQDSVARRRTFVETVFAKREFGVALAVLGLIVFGIITRSDVFLTLGNLVGVLRNAAVVTVIGFGMTMLITSGEFDLSVGSVMALAAALTATMITDGGFSIMFTLLVILILAILYGLVQGILVTKLGLPSLIVTIGTLTLLRGGHLIILGNVTQTVPSNEMPRLLNALGGVINLPFPVLLPYTDVTLFTIPEITYQLGFLHSSPQTFDSFPLQIVWVVLLGAIFHYILFYTRFGYRTQATGGDERSARYTGVKTSHIKMANFAIVAVLAAFAGMGQLAFTGNVSPLTGNGQELVVIAAVVIGGTDLFGGEGTTVGTFLGALVFAFTQNILVLAGFGTQLFAVFTGMFIIFAVGVDAITRRARYENIWELFLTPLGKIVMGPGEFYEWVDDTIQGVDSPLAFLGLLVSVIVVPLLLVVTLTFVGGGIIGGGFSLFIVGGDVAAYGTLPLVVTVGIATILFLTVVFTHAVVKLMGGAGDIDKTVQAVTYSLAPFVLAWLPLALAGLDFIDGVVAATGIPLVVAGFFLLWNGVAQLHEFDKRKAAIVVGSTVLLWAITLVYVAGQL